MTTWEKRFDAELKKLYGITINDTDPTLYKDLLPEDAALQWGEDYGLDRIDQGWI